MLDYQNLFGALVYACYLDNKLPSSAIVDKTHLKVWSGKVVQDYNLLWVFDCPAYYHVKKDKLGPRARKGVFIGFKKGKKAIKFGI